MSDTLNARRCGDLADKDPGVGLPGRVYLPGYSRTMGPQVVICRTGAFAVPDMGTF